MGELAVETVPLARLFPSPTNPRKNDDAVTVLAVSLERLSLRPTSR